jgi:TolB-like protein
MIYRFGQFELDTTKAELRAGGTMCPLEPQVYAVLALLVENRERLVSVDELIEKVWNGRVVSDAAVASRIRSVRQALGDDGQRQAFVRTLPRRGFRFVADVGIEPAVGWQAEVPETSSRPSIAVLPFDRVGEARVHAAIADALPHDLIAAMSRLRWLLVTARGSSFRLRGSGLDPAEAGRLLGVRYCITGTIEVGAERIAVVVELVDTSNSGVVWAERFDDSADGIHEIRAEILAQTLVALELHIPLHEANLARLSVSGSLDAWSSYHLGLQHMFRFNRRDNAVALGLFEQALAQDRNFARACAGLSFVHFQNAFLRYTDDRSSNVELARRFADQGLHSDPLDPFVQFAMGRSYWLEGDLDTSLQWLMRAVETSPSYAQGLYALAWTETFAGNGKAARDHVDLAMRLSPLDPLQYAMQAIRALNHLAENENQEAITWAERAARAPGAHVLIAMIAAAVLGAAGEPARAGDWARNALSRDPDLTRDHFFRAFPVRDPGERARLDDALKQLSFR